MQENRQCFWNTELSEAVKHLVYIGFIRPGTLFVSSPESDSLDVIRYAWTNRVLKPAKGYVILTIGQLSVIFFNFILLTIMPSSVVNDFFWFLLSKVPPAVWNILYKVKVFFFWKWQTFWLYLNCEGKREFFWMKNI